MPRPCRRRRVCAPPGCGRFCPAEGGGARQAVSMTLEEYETIRLIDLCGMTQEQCARQMDVARTTAQAIYADARRKLAECLVNGRELVIGGGEYRLCTGQPGPGCSCRSAPEKPAEHHLSGGKQPMKLAVTYENGQVFQHFGHTEQFKLYEVENCRVVRSEVVGTNGSGHGALAGLLRQLGVDALICGGIGGGAQQALAEAGIELYGGVTGGADEAVEAFLNGHLVYDPAVRCEHHEHREGGSCGAGGCGGHGCAD